MNERDFVYWLNGHVELNPAQEQPTPAQWKMIKEHLALVMTKVTPLLLRSTGLNERNPDTPWVPHKNERLTLPPNVTCDSTRKIC